jgi:uncharacterized membrane protein
MLALVEALQIFSPPADRVAWARKFLVLAVLGSTAAAFFSGYQASAPLGDIPSEIQDVLGRHHAVGRLMLINSLLLLTFFVVAARAVHGKKVIEALYRLMIVAQLAMALWVGSLGGSLVFDHGVGVNRPRVEASKVGP